MYFQKGKMIMKQVMYVSIMWLLLGSLIGLMGV